MAVVVVPAMSQHKSSQALTAQAERLTSQLISTLAWPDRADYDGDFYYRQCLVTLQARDEMPWGKTVPDSIFFHFVLPVRVNNENLDTARIVFYNELKDRVKTMTMQDAILEVNHWCHEKVSYRPSDARTSSPLATVRTAYGRCGEESTFLVAALRSVGIPARQVYTPRWAHTDDNHAWVEAWADGRWYFLGACEPEPVLNLGWFNEGASRAMLMHTKVVGDYRGTEEVISRTPYYTEINVTDNYAPTSTVTIVVVDGDGKPVEGADVEFKIYNYAEFYTLAKRVTDNDGSARLSAGRGDLLVWVTKNERVALKKVSWRTVHADTIVLDRTVLPEHLNLDIVPPQAGAALPPVTAEQQAVNDRRKAQEDSLRHAYEATMPVEAWRGNHRTIQQFLDEAQNKTMAGKLLEVVSAKDLRDITLEVLKDNEVATTDTSYFFCRYVLNPRVENEWLTPYKAFFRSELQGKISTIGDLVTWTKENITVDNGCNPQRLRQQPMSVYRNRRSDALGRDIFFVSAARSLGWPARINEVTGKVEFLTALLGGTWQAVSFDDADTDIRPTTRGTLHLNLAKNMQRDDLAYYTHFTLSKIVDGKAQLLTFADDATWQTTFSHGVSLDAGTYLLTTGNRQSDGSVLASCTRFAIAPNEHTNVTLALREKQQLSAVLGSIEPGLSFFNTDSGAVEKLPENEDYILGFILPSHEPTNHALRDISTYAASFEQWGGKILLLSLSDDQARRFNKREFSALPSNVIWGIDSDTKILQHVNAQLRQQVEAMPLFILVNKNQNITFVKQGYTINLGDQLLESINQ